MSRQRTVPAGVPVRLDARVLLLTRYASLAVWEASRADTGRNEFQRRHKLTRATIVCTAVPG